MQSISRCLEKPSNKPSGTPITNAASSPTAMRCNSPKWKNFAGGNQPQTFPGFCRANIDAIGNRWLTAPANLKVAVINRLSRKYISVSSFVPIAYTLICSVLVQPVCKLKVSTQPPCSIAAQGRLVNRFRCLYRVKLL